MASAAIPASKTPFKSELAGARERFLAQVLVHGFEDGWRTADDFLREFPPMTIMEALSSADGLRARILVMAAGVHERLAQKKSIASAGEDLALALQEGVTDAASVLEIFTPDDRVRYLDAAKLWSFLTAGDFWKTRAQDASHKRAVARMTFILERALAENLITLKDFADGVTFEEIADRLPVLELKKVVTHALKASRSGEPLNEVSLTEVVPLPTLVGYLPLDHVWRGVVLEKIAAPLQFGKAERVPTQPGKNGESKSASLKPGATGPVAAVKAASAAPEPSPAPPARPAHASDAAIDVDVNDLEFEAPAGAPAAGPPAAAPPPDATGGEEETRHRTIENLRALDRLPPQHEQLSLPILLSIESMYADLLEAASDEQREELIRDAFPNESHLRSAMLALIELLDPTINTSEPLIRDADVESLIKIVLFEERHRYEQAHASRSAPPQRSRSIPPPLPGRE